MMKVCPKCKTLNGENASKCTKCGYEFTEEDNNAARYLQNNIENPENSRVFKIIAIIVAVCGFIDGIILGKFIPMKSDMEFDKFNTPLMIVIWLVAVGAVAMVWAVSCHLKNQENQTRLLLDIEQELASKNEQE
ncbi:MAG: hypothetical protein E7572_12900 [Ruminococcaceae bacterium]|jgi:uncharacterized membrane protein YvbJ|nr:hypothetical protein [Oscillospiraceae bacterium]